MNHNEKKNNRSTNFKSNEKVSSGVSVQFHDVNFLMCYLVRSWSPKFEGKLENTSLLLETQCSEIPLMRGDLSIVILG